MCDSLQSDWKIVKRGYDAHILGEADQKFKDPIEGLKKLKVCFIDITFREFSPTHQLKRHLNIYDNDRSMSYVNQLPKCWHNDYVKEGRDVNLYGNSAIMQASKDGGKPVSDQLLPPFVIVDDSDKPVGAVQDGDAVIIFNFRADRVVEISKALEYEKFDKFERKRFPKVKLMQIQNATFL